MNELIDTTEMYLRTIYELEEEGVRPLRARLVERLGVSAPAVSETVNRLIKGGVSGDRLKGDSVTGKQINESTLAMVPSARSRVSSTK